MTTVRLSSKGQIVIPKAVRQAHGWRPGQEFVVEPEADGLWLRPRPLFPPTTLNDAFGCLLHEGPPLSLGDMTDAVERSARLQWTERDAPPPPETAP